MSKNNNNKNNNNNSKKRKQPSTLDDRLKTSIYSAGSALYEFDPHNPLGQNNNKKQKTQGKITKEKKSTSSGPAWHDDDDEDIPVNNSLNYSDNDYVSLNPDASDLFAIKQEDDEKNNKKKNNNKQNDNKNVKNNKAIKQEEQIKKEDNNKNKSQNTNKVNNQEEKEKQVSLREFARLKKLRKDVDEDMVSEKELNKRLREHFEAAIPTPDWAKIDTKEDDKVRRVVDNDSDDESLLPTLNVKTARNAKPSVELVGTIVHEEGDGFQLNQADIDPSLANDSLTSIFSTNQRVKNTTQGRATGTLTTQSLKPGKLYVDRLPDANVSQPCTSVASTVKFHPNNQLVMVGSKDTTLRLYQIDATNYPCVQSLAFQGMQIDCADFVNNYTEIVACSQKKKYFGSFNLETGQTVRIPEIKGREESGWGYFRVSHNGKYIALIGDNTAIVILSAITKQFICEIRGRARVQDITWSADDKTIFAAGLDGHIYGFDMASRQQIFCFQDYGAVQSSAIGVSSDGKYMATGNNSGTVNVYDTDFSQLIQSQNTTAQNLLQDSFASFYSGYNSYEDNSMSLKSRKDPLTEITNLTTKIEQCVFSPSNEMLVITSRQKKDQLRVVHLPTFKVFENWPTQNTPFGYIQDVAFSHDNTRMAVANDRGKVLLYKLEHYIPNCNKM